MGDEDIKLSIAIDAVTAALQGKMDNLISSMGNFSTYVLAAGGIYGFADVIYKSVDAFSKLEDKMALIKTLGVDDMGLGNLKDELIEISLEVPVAATELAEAAYQGMSAGIAVENVAEAARVAALAAKAGMSDTTTAIDGMTTVMNVWEGKVGSATNVMDTFLATQNYGKTTLGEMASTIGQVAPTAEALGVSFNDLAGATAFLTSNGINTSSTMTGLKAAFSNIMKPTDDASKMAAQLGLDFSIAGLKSKGFSGFVNDLAEKLKDYEADGGDATDATSKLFGSVEGLNVMLKLTGSGLDKYNDMNLKVANSSGTLNKMAQDVTSTFSAQKELIQNHLFAALERVGEIIVENIVPSAENVIEIIDLLIDGVEPLLQLIGPELKYTLMLTTNAMRELAGFLKELLTPFALLGSQADITSRKFEEYLAKLEKMKRANVELVAQQSGLYQKLMLDAEVAANKKIALMQEELDAQGNNHVTIKLTLEEESALREKMAKTHEETLKKERAIAEQRYNQYLDVIVQNQQLLQDSKSLAENYSIFNIVLNKSYVELDKLTNLNPKMQVDIQDAVDKINQLQLQFETAKATGNNLEMLITLKELDKAKAGLDELITQAGKVPNKKETEVAVTGKNKMIADLDELDLKLGNISKVDNIALGIDNAKVMSNFDALGEDIKKKKDEIEKANILTPSVDNQAALDRIREIETSYNTLRSNFVPGDLVLRPEFDPTNLNNVKPVLKEAVLVPVQDIADTMEYTLEDSFNFFINDVLISSSKVGRAGIEGEFQNLFHGQGFSFKNVLDGMNDNLFKQMSKLATSAIVGENGNGGILGTITGALGTTGPVGMAVIGGISALWSLFGNKPKEEDLFNKIGAEIQTAFSDAIEDFWDNFRDKAVETLSDIGSDKSKLIQDSFQGLFDSIMDGLGDSFDFEEFSKAIKNGADDTFSQIQVKGWLDGALDWNQLSSEVQTLISTFFRNYEIGFEGQINEFTSGWQRHLDSMLSRGLITKDQYDQALALIGQYSDEVRSQVYPLFEEFQTKVQLDPENAETYFEDLQIKLAYLWSDLNTEFGSYQDLVDALSKKLADTAASTQNYSQELIDRYMDLVRSGALTLEQVAGQVGPEFADLIKKSLELAAQETTKTVEEEQIGDDIGHQVGKNVSDGMADGISSGTDAVVESTTNSLNAINKKMEDNTSAWQRLLLDAYGSGKTLTTEGTAQVKEILLGLLQSGAVSSAELIQKYGTAIIDFLGLATTATAKASEDMDSSLSDVGLPIDDYDRQVAEIQARISQIRERYDQEYKEIAIVISSVHDEIKSYINTELAGIDEVIAKLQERFDTEMKFLDRQNSENETIIGNLLSLYGELGQLNLENQEGQAEFAAEQQKQIDALNAAKEQEIAQLDEKINKLRDEGYTQEQIAAFEAEKMRYINETIIKMEQEGASAQDINAFRNTELNALNEKINLMSASVISEEQIARFRASELADIEKSYAQKQAEIEQTEYQSKMTDEALALIRKYNEEQLENLTSVNEANSRSITYKIQQSELDDRAKAIMLERLAQYNEITDQEQRQQALLGLANELKQAGITINLQDYQVQLQKENLTSAEVQALQQKKVAAEEMLKDMKEDLDIQRQRLIDAGLPTLEVERQMALLKQEQLQQIADELGISFDQLDVMNLQVISTEEQKKAALELAQQQIGNLDAELAKMAESGATQEEINTYRLESLKAIASNLGLEYNQLDGLLRKNENIRESESQALAYQQAQLTAIQQMTTATSQMTTAINQLSSMLQSLAWRAQDVANTNVAQPFYDAVSAVQNLNSELQQAKDAAAGINTPGISAEGPAEASYDIGTWNVPRDLRAQLHAGETVLTADLSNQMRDMGLLDPSFTTLEQILTYLQQPSIPNTQLAAGNTIIVQAPVTFTGPIDRSVDVDDLLTRASDQIAEKLSHLVAVPC